MSPMTPDVDKATMQFIRSQYREKMIEHVFVAELWKEAWFRRQTVLEVLRSEVDGSGFDLLLEWGGIQRHVQLKASVKGGSTRHQNVNAALANRAGGCVVWIVFDGNPSDGLTTLEYLFFGGTPGEDLPSLDIYKLAKHTKANAKGVKGERPSIRRLSRSQFTEIDSTAALFTTLFG